MNTRPSQCFECETGTYKDVSVNYFSHLSEGRSCVTKDVTIQRCDTCGAEILDSKASKIIESNIERNFPDHYDKWKTKNKPRL
jgi:YgiT-type zinc finger domain-containing protein